jgi:hypothetical protein
VNLADGLVEAVIEVHGRLRPKSGSQLLPGHQVARFFQQHRQQSEGLLLQPPALVLLCQFPGSKIGFESPEPQTPGWVVGLLHGNPQTGCFRNLLCRLRQGTTGNRGKTPGSDAFFVCVGSEQSDSSYV